MLELRRSLSPAPRWFSRARGVGLASLGDRWAAHSALSGTSHLLTDESAAIVLAVPSDAPLSTAAVCATLASEWNEPAAAIEALLAPMWDQLVTAGLVTAHGTPAGR